MSLLTKRDYYKPFVYPKAYEFWELQQTSFWIHTEINMDSDIYDWQFNLTKDEKHIIGNILKSFVQSEILIGDYWRKVADVFPHPEIAMMAAAFSSFESIHIASYAYLNDSLGIDNWQEFMQDKVVMERLEQIAYPPEVLDYCAWNLQDCTEAEIFWKRRTAISLAVFSAFGEGVALFSAFTILLSFAQRGLMKGLGQIIEMSIRDESLHAKAGIWLFNEFMKENKDVHDVKKPIYEAAELTVTIEDKFIDQVFAGTSLPNCTPEDLKQFIRHRANAQLRSMGMRAIFKTERAAIKHLGWFNVASAGDQHADFFASRVTTYARTSGWGQLWENV